MILQSEISNEGMVLIMEKLHTYVPTVSTPIELECPKSDEPTTMITTSGRDGGTLYQLRNLINRHNDIKKPMDNLDGCEDFIVLVTEAHILSAAMTLFSMENLEDRPSMTFFGSPMNLKSWIQYSIIT